MICQIFATFVAYHELIGLYNNRAADVEHEDTDRSCYYRSPFCANRSPRLHTLAFHIHLSNMEPEKPDFLDNNELSTPNNRVSDIARTSELYGIFPINERLDNFRMPQKLTTSNIMVKISWGLFCGRAFVPPRCVRHIFFPPLFSPEKSWVCEKPRPFGDETHWNRGQTANSTSMTKKEYMVEIDVLLKAWLWEHVSPPMRSLLNKKKIDVHPAYVHDFPNSNNISHPNKHGFLPSKNNGFPASIPKKLSA